MKIIDKQKELREDIAIIRSIERQLENNLLQRRIEISITKDMFGMNSFDLRRE